jgi:hypothetical protein
MLIGLLQYRSIPPPGWATALRLWVHPAGRQTAVYSSIVPWNAVGMQIRSGAAAPEPHYILSFSSGKTVLRMLLKTLYPRGRERPHA